MTAARKIWSGGNATVSQLGKLPNAALIGLCHENGTNLKERKLPSDITDVLGIAIAHAVELRYNKVISEPNIFNNMHDINVMHSLI